MINTEQILTALGGRENISTLESCITRLRVQVIDVDKVKTQELKDAGAFGVVISGTVIQVVIGPQADTIAKELGGE